MTLTLFLALFNMGIAGRAVRFKVEDLTYTEFMQKHLQLLSQRHPSNMSTKTMDPCPATYNQCFTVQGCVYVPKKEHAKLDELPELQRHAHTCLSKVDLLADVAPSVKLLEREPEGDAVKVKTMRSSKGDRWIAIADLCGEGQAWTAAQCQTLCPKDHSWQTCIAQSGCAYVYASNKVSNLPSAHREALKPTFGNCVAVNGLIGSSPTGSTWRSPETGKASMGLLVKALDPNTREPVKRLLSFPLQPPLPGQPDHKECDSESAKNLFQSLWPSPAHRKENLLQACRCSYWQRVASVGAISQVLTDYHFAKQSPDGYLLIDYGCWRNVLSRELRMPVQFEYVASADTGNHDRSHKFSLDETPGLLAWQPPKWSRSDRYGAPYDVGHLVMANHFDSYKELIHTTNLMTNVVPQLKDMNRYAWLSTEYLTECAREGTGKENVFVIGGCVWPDEPDHIKGFKKMGSYQIKIPDYCWKVISTPARGHVAFLLPNTVDSKITKSTRLGSDGVERGLTALSQFVVSLAELELNLSTRQTPQTFQLSKFAHHDKNYKPSARQMSEAGWSLKCNHK